MNTTYQTYDFLAPPTQPSDLGMLGSYRIISELGKGGMGYVFRAEDTRLKRTVALKVMNKKIAATPNSRKRFLEEARAMAAVHHDNVVVIFEVGERTGTPFMAMELLKGQTLEGFNLKKSQLDYQTILDYAKQISRGLAAAHAKGIVHRDIKPANIWVEEGTQRIKILDFGLALAQTPVDRLGGTGSVIGTPGYLSPEQARTDPLDDRSDLYSLGVVLYELGSGRLPLASSTVAGQLVAILAHKPKPIRELNPQIPQPLADLIHQLLAKESRDRPASAAILEKELDRVTIECESKSEVALAINKLQQGLSEVVSKKQEDDLFSAAAIASDATELEDPLAFPASPVTFPAASVKPPATAQSMPSALPPQRKAAASEAGFDWKKAWPFVAIGLGALLLIPIAIFAFSGSSDSPVAESTAMQTEASAPSNAGTNAGTNADKNADLAIDSPLSDHLAANSQQDDPEPQNSGKRNQQTQQQQRDRQQPSTAQSNGFKEQRDPSIVDDAGDSDSPGSNAAEFDRPLVAMRPPEDDSDLQSDLPPDSSSMIAPASLSTDEAESVRIPTERSVRTKIVSISTNVGIGADASVRSNAFRQAFGSNPSIAVQARDGNELEHAYMRFDLSSLGVSRQSIREAMLELTMPGRIRHSGAWLRLLGTDEPIAEKWKDSGPLSIKWSNSFSSAGLDSVDSLVELDSRASLGDQEIHGRRVRLISQSLAEFLRTAKTKSVTLILVGGKPNGELVPFVSREADAENAPRLVLKVAQEQ